MEVWLPQQKAIAFWLTPKWLEKGGNSCSSCGGPCSSVDNQTPFAISKISSN